MTNRALAAEAIGRGAVQKPTELSWLLTILQPRKLRRVLEIGSKDGGTLWLWRQLAPEVVSIDINPVPLKMDGVTLIQGDSHVVSVTGRFDFVFIDGDHTYEGVRADFEDYSMHSSLIALHDIAPYDGPEDRGVSRLWDELKQEHSTREWIDPSEHQVRGEVLTARDGGIGLVFL